MGRTACTEPQCLYRGALYLTSVPVQGCTLPYLSVCTRAHFSFYLYLRKIAESSYELRHVCPSVRPRGTTRLPPDGFSWNLVRIFLENLSIHLKFDRNLPRITATLHEALRVWTFIIVPRWNLLRMINFSDESWRENQNTHSCSIIFFFETRATYFIYIYIFFFFFARF